MQCLVLGGAGFMGSHIADVLVAKGHHVRVFDRPNVNMFNLQYSLHLVEFMGGDFNNIHDMSRALDNIDIVVHLVGSTLPEPSNKNPAYDIESNLIGTIKFLDMAVKREIKKIVFASSGGTVYGLPVFLPIPETHQTNPLCSYGITKLTIEKYLALYDHLYNLDFVVLRLGNPYGERQRIDGAQGVISVFLGKILYDQELTIWGDGSVTRDYFYISDLVSAFLRVIESDTKSKIYNIGSGYNTSLNEILTVIQEVTGRNPLIKFTAGRKVDVPINYLDISRAKSELDWQPRISLRDGIAKTWEWVKTLPYQEG
jgi:UDP-glucose 4-epimerase